MFHLPPKSVAFGSSPSLRMFLGRAGGGLRPVSCSVLGRLGGGAGVKISTPFCSSARLWGGACMWGMAFKLALHRGFLPQLQDASKDLLKSHLWQEALVTVHNVFLLNCFTPASIFRQYQDFSSLSWALIQWSFFRPLCMKRAISLRCFAGCNFSVVFIDS